MPSSSDAVRTALERAATMAQKSFIGRLSCATTDQGLLDFFSQAGEVVSATVV